MATTVLIADKLESAGIEGIKALGCAVVSLPDVGAERLPQAVAEHDPRVVIVRSTKVGAPAIHAGQSLRLVVRAGAGYDTIDTKTAAARGVAVCNTPGMNAVAVAELALGMILALDRRLVEQTDRLRAGAWDKKEFSKARGIKGQTLGLIGLGSIGREMTVRAQAFGMGVIAHSLNMTPDRAADLRVQYGGRTRDELLGMLPKCDVVSVHVAANVQSERMADGAFFAAMRPGAMFINTSRGSVVDEAALAHAVRTRGIRAGLDVYEQEPAGGTAAWKPPLADLPGVVLAHHVGASTEQAQNAVAEETVRVVREYVLRGVFENRVN
ncbi:MAG: phosphoglycerate dehydrogenase [Planctomyces sp.]|nr:phosphoglycerate dehydrogenase [Planctomyces sp.]MBA4120111.1 phosphoglycerate dehydrogenase [Isosphaera sp.]